MSDIYEKDVCYLDVVARTGPPIERVGIKSYLLFVTNYHHCREY